MPRARQYIVFEGLFSERVLGIFRIIRGFADLRDLAAVSVPYQMEHGEQGFQVSGHQREESAKHAEEIKIYLEQSENRFLPHFMAWKDHTHIFLFTFLCPFLKSMCMVTELLNMFAIYVLWLSHSCWWIVS